MLWILLLLTLIVTTKPARSTNMCLYNWQISADRRQCELSCGIPGNASQWNSYCDSVNLQGVNVLFNSSDCTFTMPLGISVNTPVPGQQSSTEFNLTFNSRVNPKEFFGNLVNAAVNLQSLISPQLLQCQTIKTDLGDYYLDETEFKVFIPDQNITAYLGDFYVDENSSIHTCSESIDVNLFDAPRCNYVTMHSNDYIIHDNGSISIPRAGFTIQNPVYSLIVGQITAICIPLNINFINCPNKQLVNANRFLYNRDLQITIDYYSHVLDLDYFFFSDDGSVVCCSWTAYDKEELRSIVEYSVFSAIDYISCVCLVFILIFRFKMFIQNNHTRCMLLHIVCLTISNLASTFHSSTTLFQLPVVVFSFTYYFFLSGIFWLNAISYDSWQYFTRMQQIAIPRTRRNKLTRFVVYNLYSWGLSLILLIFLLSIEFISPLCDVTFGLCPHFKYKGWFNNQDSYIIYFCAPLNICTVINLIFLVLIIRIVYQAGIGTDIVNNQRISQIVRMSLKLFILTGLNYTVIMFGSIVMANNNNSAKYLMKLINFMLNCQGIIIFLTYYSTAELVSIFKHLCHRPRRGL